MRQRPFKAHIVILIVALFTSQPYMAQGNELTDAQANLQQLQTSLEQDNEYVNKWFPEYSAQATECIQKYANSSNADEIAQRDSCQIALSRFQADRASRLTRITETIAAIQSLRLQISGLASSGTSSAQNTNTSSSPSPGAVSSTSSNTNEASSPTPQSSAGKESAVSTEGQSTLPMATSESAATMPNQTPIPQSGAVVTETKSELSKTNTKVAPKKMTIVCIKGKTIRKVTAVKPTCPKGFKIKK